MNLERSLLGVVTSTLDPRHEPSPPKRLRLSEVNANDDEAVPEWDCSAPYEQWLDYSAYENRHETPSIQSSSQESLEGSGTHNGDDGEDGDVVEIRKNGNTTTMPTFFHPNVDMTTALLSSHPWIHPTKNPALLRSEDPLSVPFHHGRAEPLELVPHLYSYAVKITLLPVRKVQHQLVINYFQYIHPMFPVVDEYHFTEMYRRYRGCEQFMEPEDFMLYQAIIAAGFGHLSESQLQRTPYVSVHEGQQAQFDQVKARYWSEPTSDPVVLTQICLIISLWSPGSAGTQNNSYWLNLAFKHATVGELWKPVPPVDGRPCRRRLLWWCCMVRDRVLALGMRRPYRLHKDPFEETLISELDFGLEATSPLYTDIHSKRISIMAFIWLCKLSEIMAAIAVFQRRNRFSRDWDGEAGIMSATELKDVSSFDQDLEDWKEAFEAHATELTGHDGKDSAVPFIILRVVCNCLLAVLYQPYLHISWIEHTQLSQKTVDPLQRMKEGARAVELSVFGLISSKKSDTLPNWLVSWVTLPAAVHYVQQRVMNSTPDKVLVPCLNKFMRRTTGAQHMFLILIRATKESLQRHEQCTRVGVDGPHEPTILGRSIAPSIDRLSGAGAIPSVGMSRITEARILASVTRALDAALELNC